MTRVVLRGGDVCSVMCRGHATGRPDVCAAVSCLLYTAAGYLRNSEAAVLTEKLESGDAYLAWEGDKWLYELLKIGFLQLELTAPEAVQVKTEKK